ncbi:unnamed protein product [Merluccius merluccius]
MDPSGGRVHQDQELAFSEQKKTPRSDGPEPVCRGGRVHQDQELAFSEQKKTPRSDGPEPVCRSAAIRR